jgi:hypothetical protein
MAEGFAVSGFATGLTRINASEMSYFVPTIDDMFLICGSMAPQIKNISERVSLKAGARECPEDREVA